MDPKPRREMKVLALGLPRSGTLTMATALTILGYKDVHHTLTDKDSGHAAWRILNRAADASFPGLSTYTGQPFTREQWDEVYGSHEAVTEAASLFAKQLIKTYPDAKVVLVRRDFDRWYASFDKIVLQGLWGPLSVVFVFFVQPLKDIWIVTDMRKALLGFFEAGTVDELRANARAVYDRHHREIQELVPKDQLLMYNYEDGWEPLCEFLGKPIPETKFPRVNERAELMKKNEDLFVNALTSAAMVLVPWAVGAAGAVGLAAWMMTMEQSEMIPNWVWDWSQQFDMKGMAGQIWT